eukprot:TRINITY_DN40061_c0_g1_i1.p1 TRINITY_DN40061_c0_g1~~TRINITY_DN40061_c0_g1_i1.p1  ORF type:complete len:1679 (+),score=469.96 TRINITY_DN40061_c0_g1_i1:270-5039(+)
MQIAVCMAHIPACTASGAAVLPCTEACASFMRACRAAAAAAKAMHVFDCSSWQTDAECAAFDSHGDCVTVADATSTRGRTPPEALASSCVNDAFRPANATEAVALSSRGQSPVPGWRRGDSESQTVTLLLWALCLTAGLLLSIAGTAPPADADTQPRPTCRERVLSVRYLAQASTMLIAWCGAAGIYWLVSSGCSEDSRRCYDVLQEASDECRARLALMVDESVAVILDRVEERVDALLLEVQTVFTTAHSDTLARISDAGRCPCPTAAGAAAALSPSLVGLSASSVLEQCTLALSVRQPVASNDTVLVPRRQAALFLDLTAATPQNLGAVGGTPVVFDSKGNVLADAPPVSAAAVPAWSAAQPFHNLQHGTMLWSPLWILGSELAVTLEAPSRDPSTGAAWSSLTAPQPCSCPEQPAAPVLIGRVLRLSYLSDRLRALATRDRERIVLLRKDAAGCPVLAATHGLLTVPDPNSPGLPTHANSSSLTEKSARAVAANFLARLRVASLCDVPAGSSAEVYDDVGTLYLAAVRPAPQSSFPVLIFWTVPVLSVEAGPLFSLLAQGKTLNTTIDQLLDDYEEQDRFRSSLSLALVCIAFLFAGLASAMLINPVQNLSRHFGDVVWQLRVEVVARRLRQAPRARLMELRLLRGHLARLIQLLREVRHYAPDLTVISALADERVADDEHDRTLEEQAHEFTHERVCKVTVVYASRSLLKQLQETSDETMLEWRRAASLDGSELNRQLLSTRSTRSPRARSGSLSPTASGYSPGAARRMRATKRIANFDWHYRDPAHASLNDLLSEVRRALREKVGEPMDLVAILPPVEDGADEEEFPVATREHLRDVLTLSPDKLTLQCTKASRASLLPVLTAAVSVSGKIGLGVLCGRMWVSGGIGQDCAIVLAVLLTVSFIVNTLLAFKLNRKAVETDELMRDWTEHFQTETTLVLVICGFNIQNMLVLWSGVRVGSFLRFHAPMPRSLRHQAVRWSMFSLIVGDLLTMGVAMFYVQETGSWNLFTLLSLLAQAGAIVVTSVKKFVVFILIDESRKQRDNTAAAVARQMKERLAKLHSVSGTILEVGIVGMAALSAHMTEHPRLVTNVMNTFYEEVIRTVEENRGVVVSFGEGRAVALFNYPVQLREHTRAACMAAARIVTKPEPQEVVRELGPLSMGCASWIAASVVSGEMVVGNLGSRRRKHSHAFGPLAVLSTGLRKHNYTLATAVLLNDTARQALVSSGRDHRSDFVLRPIDVIPAGASQDVDLQTVYELVPVVGNKTMRDIRRALAIAGNLCQPRSGSPEHVAEGCDTTAFEDAFEAISRGDLIETEMLLRKYTACLAGYADDRAARRLAARVARSKGSLSALAAQADAVCGGTQWEAPAAVRRAAGAVPALSSSSLASVHLLGRQPTLSNLASRQSSHEKRVSMRLPSQQSIVLSPPEQVLSPTDSSVSVQRLPSAALRLTPANSTSPLIRADQPHHAAGRSPTPPSQSPGDSGSSVRDSSSSPGGRRAAPERPVPWGVPLAKLGGPGGGGRGLLPPTGPRAVTTRPRAATLPPARPWPPPNPPQPCGDREHGAVHASAFRTRIGGGVRVSSAIEP